MTLAELNEHYELLRKLDRAREILLSLRSAAAAPRAQNLDGMPRASASSGDRIGYLVSEIAEAEANVRALQSEAAEHQDAIVTYIRSIGDLQTRIIFRLRFLRGMTWTEVADAIGGGNTPASVKMICYRHIENL